MSTTRTPTRPPRVGPVDGPVTGPHPRIRARQVEVARRRGRRRLRVLTALLAVVCVAVWVGVLLRSPVLDVDRVQVHGAERTPDAALLDAAGIAPGDPMVGADLAAVGERVASLPWVDEVVVRRRWPGTVRIVVTEREPVAIVARSDGWAVVDGTGRVLALGGARPALPLIDGTTVVLPGERLERDQRDVAAVLAGLDGLLDDEVTGALAGDDGVEVDLGSGHRVVLGDADELDDKVASALAVREQADPADGCRIDVRVPSAPVLTSGGDCA